MKSLQEHLNESLNEARTVDYFSWGSTGYGMDVTACICDKHDNPIKVDEKTIMAIIKNGDASHEDEEVIQKIFDAVPKSQYIYFTYYDCYGDEDDHEYGYWDKDNIKKGMQ